VSIEGAGKKGRGKEDHGLSCVFGDANRKFKGRQRRGGKRHYQQTQIGRKAGNRQIGVKKRGREKHTTER